MAYHENPSVGKWNVADKSEISLWRLYFWSHFIRFILREFAEQHDEYSIVSYPEGHCIMYFVTCLLFFIANGFNMSYIVGFFRYSGPLGKSKVTRT